MTPGDQTTMSASLAGKRVPAEAVVDRIGPGDEPVPPPGTAS